jgi:hypothetical protein
MAHHSISTFNITISLVFLLFSFTPSYSQVEANTCDKIYPATSEWKAAEFDPIYGGSCWSCAIGTERTVFPVTGETACVAYTKASKEGKLGCPNKYPGSVEDLGKCWKCPDGFARSILNPINGNKACERSTGFLQVEYKAAVELGSPQCDRGRRYDLVEGGTCWECPVGYSFNELANITSDKACLKYQGAKPRGSNDLYHEALSRAEIDRLKPIIEDFIRINAETIELLVDFYNSRKNEFESSELESTLRNNEFDKVGNRMRVADFRSNLMTKQIGDNIGPVLTEDDRKKIREANNAPKKRNEPGFFQTLSLGMGASAGPGVSAAGETGFVFDLTGNERDWGRGYFSVGLSGLSVGARGGLIAGLWRSDLQNLCGQGFGWSGALSTLIPVGQIVIPAGVEFTIWLQSELLVERCYTPASMSSILPGVVGFSLGAGPGYELGLGGTFTSTTVIEKFGIPIIEYCSPCGAEGQRVCSFLERFPSCLDGLKDNCGICVAM